MERKILERKLEEIKIAVSECKSVNQVGVLTGTSGLSLFHFYYSKYSSSEASFNNGIFMLENTIKMINEGFTHSTFCTGIAGFGWVVDHLEKEDFLDLESDDLLIEFDDYLYSVMIGDLKNGYYDYLHGAIGYAFYFFNRYRNTKSDFLKEKYKVILLEFIDLLSDMSEKDNENKLKWSSIYDPIHTKRKVYNLGLSHGMSSIIAILTKLYQHKDFIDKVEGLLRSSIDYVLQFKKENSFSLFPSWIPTDDEIPTYQSRVAWCYGDLGIGVRFWYASKVLRDKNLSEIAISIVKEVAKRKDFIDTKVYDAGICHGSYGNAQMFFRMYKETKVIDFKKASEFWIKDGIRRATHKDGYAGYKQWDPYNDRWVPEISILEGISGIGLTIISFLSDFDTNWDECLMIS